MQVRAGHPDLAEQTYRRLSALPDKRYKPLHALFLFQSGKRDQALAELEKLSKDDPDDRDARTRLVTAYLALNRVGDAEKVLTAVLKKNPRDIDALLQRSRIYLGHAKYTEAESDLNQVLRFRSNDADAHYLLSKLREARGEPAMRQQELAEALRLNPAFTTARAELAQMLIAGRAADSALKIVDEAPAAQKGVPLILSQRNWALLALGRKPEARAGIDQALALGRSPDALLQDAVLKVDQKDYAGARASAEEALKKDPGNVHALNILVVTYSVQKQGPAGLQKAKEYSALQPKSASMQEYLGQLLAVNGDRAGARKAFETAKTDSPGFVPADLGLAQLDAADGKPQDAQKRLSDVLGAHPDNESARMLLAQLEMTGGTSSAAIDQYKKVLAQDAKNPSALNNLAYLLADANQADEALKYAQQAKEVAPDSPAVDDTLGWVYYRKGLYSMAVPYLENAATKEGTARRKYHLAMAYFKTGNAKRGRQVLDEAVKMDPKLPEADQARQLAANAKP
jgi:tetratricopeptide (TPR) repeat protein